MNARRVGWLALALALWATPACSRAIAVESEAGPVYTLELTNPNSFDLVASYDDGTGSHLLGTVGAGRTEIFVITRPASRSVQIVAVDDSRVERFRATVTLNSGSATRLRLD
ncbi:MAG: hypothetical protein ACRELD_07205 [Longimicrobiales bacterium]